MCGRFVQGMTSDEVSEFLSAIWAIEVTAPPSEVQKSFNLAPGQIASVAIRSDQGLTVSGLNWGIAAFTPPNRPAIKPINARIETASTKPTFRSLLLSYRCIVPATGYFEWRASANSANKQPYFIHHQDGSQMLFAGLWSPTKNETPSSFVILTTAAKDQLREIHDRMPVILNYDDALEWVSGEPELDDEVIVKKVSTRGIVTREVSRKINNPKNNSPELLERRDDPPMEQGIF